LTNTMTLQSGLMGVGTSNPDFTLHIHGASDGAGYVKISDSNTGEGATDGARIGFNSGVMRIQNFQNSDMEFYVNNTTKPLVLESDGSSTFAGDVTISGGDMTLTGATTSIIGEQSAGANRGKIKFVTSGSDGDIVFETTTNGAGAITEAGRFTHDGNFKVINNLIIDSTAGDVTKQKIQFHDDNVGLQRAQGSDRTANGNSLYISAFEDIVFTASGAVMGSQTERMRITDDGNVGIGVSSLETQNSQYVALQLGGNANIIAKITDQASNPLNILQNAYAAPDTNWKKIREDQSSRYHQQDGAHTFFVNNVTGAADDNITWATALTIGADANATFGGNVGIGLTPEADWLSTRTALQIGGSGAIFGKTSAGAGGDLDIGQNVYFHSGGSYRRIDEDEASMYSQNDGTHNFMVAGSSTDNSVITFTDVFKLDINSRISLSNNDSGSHNTIFGYQSANSIASGGDYNVVFGDNALYTEDAGDKSTAIGYSALYSQNVGSGTSANTGVGLESLKFNVTGTYNTAVGHEALLGASGNSHSYNVGVGANSLKDVTTGDSNVAVGAFSLENNTSGVANVAIGSWDSSTYQAPLTTNTVGSFNIAIGSGVLRLANENDNDGSVGIGYGALNNQAGTGGAQFANATVAVGYKALETQTTELGNTAIGHEVGQSIRHDSSDYNVFMGYQACVGGTGARSQSIAIGYRAWGNGGVQNNIGGAENVFIGSESGGGTWATGASDGNTAVGWNTMKGAMNGATINTAFGKNALLALSTGDYNSIVGGDSGKSINTGSHNSTLGADSLADGTDAEGNVAIGSSAMYNSVSPDNCVAVGRQAIGVGNNTQDGSIAIGYAAMNNLSTGAGNVGVGFEVMKQVTTGKHNTSVGYQSMYNAMNVGDSNTAIGYQSLYSLDPDTDDHGSNTALGKQSGYDVSTGTGNVLVGANAGNSGSNDLTTGDNNTYIGNEATGSSASNSNSTVIGATAIGSGSNTVVLGNASVTDVYMAQDSGATVHTAGIQFPSSQAASGGANVLDDYEEGDWTPSVGGNASYDETPVGKYVKVGKLVHITGKIRINAIGTGSTTILSGLPFANHSDTQATVNINYFAGIAISTISLAGYIEVGESVINFSGLASSATTMGSGLAIFGSGADLYFSASYQV
jgi:hypothetical protein